MPVPPLPYPHRPFPQRPPLKWPNGARLAFWLIPNIEVFAIDEVIGARVEQVIPNVPAFAMRDYGARIGVWRIAEVLQRHGVRATVTLNSNVCDAYPEIVPAGVELGWEFMGHGETNTRRLSDLSREDEDGVIGRVTRRITEAAGRAPAGWLGPGLMESANTLDLLIEHGYSYVADWVNDDQPYRMQADGRTIYSIPYTQECNDIPAYERANLTPDGFEAMIRRQFDVLYRESETTGKVMAIAIHPYLTGVPHRIDALDRAIRYILGHEGVWAATGSEIVDAYASLGLE